MPTHFSTILYMDFPDLSGLLFSSSLKKTFLIGGKKKPLILMKATRAGNDLPEINRKLEVFSYFYGFNEFNVHWIKGMHDY